MLDLRFGLVRFLRHLAERMAQRELPKVNFLAFVNKDRVLIRTDGRQTYFASDVAYHKDKLDRGFDEIINVWGSDHHGYIKRVEASHRGLKRHKEVCSVIRRCGASSGGLKRHKEV